MAALQGRTRQLFSLSLDCNLCDGMFDVNTQRMTVLHDDSKLTYLGFSTDNGPLKLILHFHPGCTRRLEFQAPSTLLIDVDKPASTGLEIALSVCRHLLNECSACGEAIVKGKHAPVESFACPYCSLYAPPRKHFQHYCSKECQEGHAETHESFCQLCK